LALALGPTCRSSPEDLLDLDPEIEARFREDLRELCGLFVVVVDSKVYLLHQTAREFLVYRPLLVAAPSLLTTSSTSTEGWHWRRSLHPRESSRILAEICMLWLSLSDFSLRGLQASPAKEEYMACRTILGYSGQFWAHHFRDCEWEASDEAVHKALLSYFKPNLAMSLAWFEIYQTMTTRDDGPPVSFISLSVASHFGLCPIVQHLLARGADVNAEDSDGTMALHHAATNGHDRVVRQLLDAGAMINATCKNQAHGCRAAIHRAAANGHTAVVKQLLDSGVDINVLDRWDSTPLHCAGHDGDAAMMQQLLEAGCDANARADHGRTPLHWAATNGDDMVAQRLLDAGGDASAKDKNDTTPLHWAVMNGRSTVAQRLLDGGADIKARDIDGATPLHWAASDARGTVVQCLLRGGANINVRDNQGRTPYQYASRRGHLLVV
jgi:ankyrin repeat protein